MSVTRLKRKHRKNIARANNKQNIIKNLLRTPVLKNVDLEELKSRFGTSAKVSDAVNTVKAVAAATVKKVKEVAADVAEAAAPAVEKVKEVAADVVAAVTPAAKEEAPAADTEAPAEASMFDKIKGFAADTVDAVTHSDVLDKAKHAKAAMPWMP